MTDVPTPAVVANRAARKYSRGEMVRRVAWMIVQPFFRLSPRPFFAWRRMLLRRFGAAIGAGVHVYPSVTIFFPWNLAVGDWSSVGEQVYIYNLGRVTIGRETTISQRSHLCAGSHDYTRPDMPLLKPPITIGNHAWICADAFVGPNVHVAEGAIVAARAVAVRDVAAWTIVAGNPARFVKHRRMCDA